MKTRRQVFGSLSGVGAGLVILGDPRSARGAPVNEQVRVAIIGVGGRGSWFVERMPEHARVVALCDVDEKRAGDAFSRIPAARKFTDFRPEFILSGNIATQLDGELEFDPVDGSFPNNARAGALRHFAYRKGWDL